MYVSANMEFFFIFAMGRGLICRKCVRGSKTGAMVCVSNRCDRLCDNKGLLWEKSG
jgi:hypothetical protein